MLYILAGLSLVGIGGFAILSWREDQPRAARWTLALAMGLVPGLLSSQAPLHRRLPFIGAQASFGLTGALADRWRGVLPVLVLGGDGLRAVHGGVPIFTP